MDSREKMALSPQNYKLILIGIAIVIVGLFLMWGGATTDPNIFNADELFSFRRITLAPIVIVGGFVFIGYAIMKPNKPIEVEEKKESKK